MSPHDQLLAYRTALKDLSLARLNKVTDDYGFRAALRHAWNLYDGLSREEQSQVLKPDDKGG